MTSPTTPSVGVVVVTHRARGHLDHCLPPLLRLAAAAARPRRQLLLRRRHRGAGPGARRRDLGGAARRLQSWPHPRGGAPPSRRRRRRDDDAGRLSGQRPTSSSRSWLRSSAAPPPSAMRGRWRHRTRTSIARFGRASTIRRKATAARSADWHRFGTYTHFCSNACAAWSCAALDRIGGFRPTLVSEETIAAAELLLRGEAIAYVAEAVVSHTHPTRLAESFRRQFDIGYTREAFRHLLLAREPDEKRGRRYRGRAPPHAGRRAAGPAALCRCSTRPPGSPATGSAASAPGCRPGSPAT